MDQPEAEAEQDKPRNDAERLWTRQQEDPDDRSDDDPGNGAGEQQSSERTMQVTALAVAQESPGSRDDVVEQVGGRDRRVGDAEQRQLHRQQEDGAGDP